MEQGFLTPLNLQDIDGMHWLLLTPLIYKASSKLLYCVQAGFLTDLASIPRGLWNVLPKTGKWDKAGVLHDWLYQFPGKLTRAEVDGLLREACQACGVGPVSRYLIWNGVRAGGWKPWNAYRANPPQFHAVIPAPTKEDE